MIERDQREALWLLADRAALALQDRQLQQRVFRSVADLQPQVEMIQRMRAAGRYDTRSNLLDRTSPAGSRPCQLGEGRADPLLGRTQTDQQSLDETSGGAGTCRKGRRQLGKCLARPVAQGCGPGQTKRRPKIHHRMDSVQHPRNEIHRRTQGA
ncbi:MAG: hypothetical protein MZV64_02275 [Ignavibacteriales bacterium]|nr:hypothetical protein [Ignavibacteriales bacterium]